MKKYYGEKMSKGFAGMPQESKMKEYPKQSKGSLGKYCDDIEGIDMFGKENVSKLMKQKKN